MKNPLLLKRFAVVAAGLFVIGCSQSGVNPDYSGEKITAATVQKVCTSSNAFGIRLFQEICEAGGESSVFISPLSVSMALGMTCNGANGTTQEAMKTALQIPALSMEELNASYRYLLDDLLGRDPKTELAIANSIWYRTGFSAKDGFVASAKDFFDAAVRPLDFTAPWAADTMNAWIALNTRDRITGMITPPIHPNAMMFLINACYFKGRWTTVFDSAHTQEAYFYAPDGTTTCAMMTRKDTMQYFENERLQAVDLPYGDGSFSMSVILPRGELTVDDLISDLTTERWDSWTGGFSPELVKLDLPQLKFEFSLELKDILTALGMGVAFTSAADFTGISERDDLFIGTVKHKALVEVNEDGTEAAAATVVMMITRASPGQSPSYKTMKVNRPFVFAIRDRVNGAILFIGKINDPTASGN